MIDLDAAEHTAELLDLDSIALMKDYKLPVLFSLILRLFVFLISFLL